MSLVPFEPPTGLWRGQPASPFGSFTAEERYELYRRLQATGFNDPDAAEAARVRLWNGEGQLIRDGRPPGGPPVTADDELLTPQSGSTRRGTVGEWLQNVLRDRPAAPYERRYRSLDKDPFCTDRSFFGSGRYRPTAYCPRDRSQAPNFVPRREPRRGPYTGAARPDGPRVFRKFGDNTRQRVMPFRRYTHMHETGYDDDVVGSERLPSFLNPAAALGQGGSEAVLTAAGLQRTLGPGRPGSQHFLLDG